MKITKLGHCCLIIETKGKRIMTDPGNFSTLQDAEKNIDVILITHEHADHYHLDSLKKVLANNPQAVIVTNTSVGKLLDKEGISYQIVADGDRTTVTDLLVEGFGKDHVEIYEQFGLVENTGYFIENKLFYPGDAFYDPKRPVDILALPVAGPWCKVKDAITYALTLKPRVAFPVHDGTLKIPGGNHRVPEAILKENKIDFVVLEIGKETEL